MPNLELLKKINAELAALKTECVSHGASSVTLSIIEILQRLTGSQETPADVSPAEDEGRKSPYWMAPYSADTAEIPAAKCPPHMNISPYGVCRDCNTCLHQFVGGSGHCNQCGELVAPKNPDDEMPDVHAELENEE